MREIKFRYLINNEWNYFSLDEIEGAMACSEVMGQHYKARNLYTGLKDKNCKEIYEGDIVRFNNQFGIIKYDNGIIGGARFMPEPIDEDGINRIFEDEMGVKFGWDELEIIGNIYENPELIKEANK